MSPVRIKLSRRKGDRKPAGARVVARPSKWGNPFKVGGDFGGVIIDNAEAVTLYREYLIAALTTTRGREELNLSSLRGRDLACWCALDEPCHADVLLELANADYVVPPLF